MTDTVLTELSALPPLVTFEEISALKSQLKQVSDGKRFMIQCEGVQSCSNIAQKRQLLGELL